eukprot:gnl/MRDRNA2_/MRDRNA2_30561_c0_seq1.p1 gnl/MRDRNA2_/MRDRNA2_30561_c0~~gnl/MRDRNA2_/MRDRNA2_30561_c0_seq1.p1  ORF type:complete len:258 (+),score=41.14 gnl/MRDRNA2_/MRDRNA2_30561_c0_seq1:2-775(+)
MYQGRKVSYSDSWVMPGDGFVGDGILQMDFCSLLRIVKGTPRTSETIIHQLLELLKGEADDVLAAQTARFCALKEISHHINVSAQQLHEMCKAFQYEKQRLDTFVMLFPRCTETGTPLFDASRGVLADHNIWGKGARRELKDRLGMPNMFDVHNMHVEGVNSHVFDLSIRDERQCACFVLKVAQAEPGMNMTNTDWTESRHPGFQVPVTWIDHCPYVGVWSVTYVCNNPERDYLPEFRSIEAKARFALHVTTPLTWY